MACVIVRAILLALLFAGLGVGIRLVTRTYLPELAAASPGAQADQKDGRGKNIDIVLPEENPTPRPRTGSRPAGDVTESAEPVDAPADGEPMEEAVALDEDSSAGAEARALGDLAEELAEELPSAAEPAQDDEEDSSGLGDSVESRPVQRRRERASGRRRRGS